MTDKRIFKPENLAVDGPKKSFIEELNLPPAAEDFLLAWHKPLLLGLAALIVLILGYSFSSQFISSREERAADQLAQAMRVVDDARRQAALEEVAAAYGRTGAGLWSRIELAHLAREAGELNQAVAAYEELLRAIPRRDPRRAMVRLTLAQLLAEMGQTEQAAQHYRELATTAGFEAWGLLGSGDILARQGDPAAAQEKYQQVLEQENAPVLLLEQAEQRLAASQ